MTNSSQHVGPLINTPVPPVPLEKGFGEKVAKWFTNTFVLSLALDYPTTVIFASVTLVPIVSCYFWKAKKPRFLFVSSVFFGAALINRLKKTYDFLTINNNLLNNHVEKQIDQLQRDIEMLESRIKVFDDFVKSNPELRKICETFASKYSDFIASNIEPIEQEPTHKTRIDKMTYLGIKHVKLEHFFKERLEFVERHKEVFECFVKHIKESKKDPIFIDKLLLLK